MKEEDGARNVGIDLAKRSYVAWIESAAGAKPEAFQGSTDEQGIERLCARLRADDRVGIECCALGFWLARTLIARVGCKTLVLNPGQLRIIYKSTKKTDLNDAQMLAWILNRMPDEELPLVPLPSEDEEAHRAMVSELHSKKHLRTELVNRLHSVFLRVGLTEMGKKDLARADARERNIRRLEGRAAIEAARLLEEIALVERHITDVERELAATSASDPDTERLFTIPGVGLGTAAAFLAYVGDGKRFANPRQVANYVGMTPRVYSSGETMRIGGISKRGCVALRSVIVQSAWAAVHTKRANVFKIKYQELYPRIGKKRAIVAIARRMLEMMWIVVTRGEVFRGYDEVRQRLKMRALTRAIKRGSAA